MNWDNNNINESSIVKCISFKLSRVRFLTSPEVQHNELVVTGSWMEQVNRICLWQYGISDSIEEGVIKPVSENDGSVSVDVLGDSSDDPRLLSAVVHHGSVQDMKVNHSTKCIYSASSNGSLQIFQLNDDSRLIRPSFYVCEPFETNYSYGNLPIALSSLALSPDGNEVYVGNDLGQLAVVRVDRFSNSTKDCRKGAITMSGADVSSVNTLVRVDNNSLVTANQLGQLKLWDLRICLKEPQRRILRPGEAQPLLCLGHHPGQPHILAVGGVENSSAAGYIWDLRAEQYPLTEIACEGNTIWEIAFHPRQPRHLYIGTETAGLLQISSKGDTDSWTGYKGSRQRLTVSSALPDNTSATGVISFDLTNVRLVCGHSDAVLQTIACKVPIY